jgi:predicted small lipoprotein YifL
MSHAHCYGRWIAFAAGCALVVVLEGCGQTGPLYIPNTPQAAQRATLPQTLFGFGKKSESSGKEASPPTPPSMTP